MQQHGRFQDLRDRIRELCAQFPLAYFRGAEEARAWPAAFVGAPTRAGWLAALISQGYGGSGRGPTEVSAIIEEIDRAGGNSASCRGQNAWTSRVRHCDLMILLARTTPPAEVAKKSEGMSVSVADLRVAIGHGLEVGPTPNMVNQEASELFFDNREIPAECRIGEERMGFFYILDGLNAERGRLGRRRAQVPRDPALPGGAGLHGHDPRLRRRACTRAAAAVVIASAPRCGPSRP